MRGPRNWLQKRQRCGLSAVAAAALLRTQFGGTGVWMFGSVAEGRLHEASDVDLAVTGLRWGLFADARDALVAIFAPGVDLVVLESAAPSLVARVQRRGIPL